MGIVRLLPTSPLALALLLYRVWRRLPASQRRRVLAAVIAYAPQFIARARVRRRERARGPARDFS
jgi:hypothetical protein